MPMIAEEKLMARIVWYLKLFTVVLMEYHTFQEHVKLHVDKSELLQYAILIN